MCDSAIFILFFLSFSSMIPSDGSTEEKYISIVFKEGGFKNLPVILEKKNLRDGQNYYFLVVNNAGNLAAVDAQDIPIDVGIRDLQVSNSALFNVGSTFSVFNIADYNLQKKDAYLNDEAGFRSAYNMVIGGQTGMPVIVLQGSNDGSTSRIIFSTIDHEVGLIIGQKVDIDIREDDGVFKRSSVKIRLGESENVVYPSDKNLFIVPVHLQINAQGCIITSETVSVGKMIQCESLQISKANFNKLLPKEITFDLGEGKTKKNWCLLPNDLLATKNEQLTSLVIYDSAENPCGINEHLLLMLLVARMIEVQKIFEKMSGEIERLQSFIHEL